MSKRAVVTCGLLLVVAVVGAAVWAGFFRTQGGSVHTVAVEKRAALSATVRATGKVDVTGKLPIPLTQAGTIRVLAVKIGDAVRTGDLIAALDDARQRQDLQAASDALDAAQYGLTNARARGTGDTAGRAAIVTAEATVQDAQRRLDTTRDALRRTLVLAPIDGTILSVSVVEKGIYNQGQEIAQVANLQNLMLTVDLDELDVPRLGDNRAATITFDAFPGKEIMGTLASVAPVATNRGGRTIYEGNVTFARPPDLALRPGMGADVTVATRTEQNVLVVPDLAVETIGAKTFLTVLHNDGSRERVEVRTGIRANGVIIIASGVSEGTR
ncbi:MAG: efflux RND transporter periplasmic adaptor subunit, partial [Chloroflexota bacterium]|nr:efflux RND transporter periplasmic adaptor subunit [Chloroflexota bacterium]